MRTVGYGHPQRLHERRRMFSKTPGCWRNCWPKGAKGAMRLYFLGHYHLFKDVEKLYNIYKSCGQQSSQAKELKKEENCLCSSSFIISCSHLLTIPVSTPPHTHTLLLIPKFLWILVIKIPSLSSCFSPFSLSFNDLPSSSLPSESPPLPTKNLPNKI